MPPNEDFENQLKSLHPMLIRYCRSLTRDSAAAEDLAQEALLRVVKRRSVRPDQHITDGYVIRTARNAWIDGYRRGSRLRTRSIEDLAVEPAAEPTPDALVTRAELETLAYRLAAKPFVILLLCDVFGFSAKEAGRCIRMAEGSVQVALSRARARLRKLSARPRKERTRQTAGPNRIDQLIEVALDAFHRRDPDLIHRAYLRLYEAGTNLVGLRPMDDRLSFTLSDPDGNLITVVG